MTWPFCQVMTQGMVIVKGMGCLAFPRSGKTYWVRWTPMIVYANFFLTEGYVMILEAALVIVNRGGEVFGIVVENSRQ